MTYLRGKVSIRKCEKGVLYDHTCGKTDICVNRVVGTARQNGVPSTQLAMLDTAPRHP